VLSLFLPCDPPQRGWKNFSLARNPPYGADDAHARALERVG
jgi:hypothetical protein